MAEAIKMPFALRTRLGLGNHVIDIASALLWTLHTIQPSSIIRLHRNWFRGTAVERWSLASKLSLSCVRPVADG